MNYELHNNFNAKILLPANVLSSPSVGYKYLVSPVEQSNHFANEKCGLNFCITLTITSVITN